MHGLMWGVGLKQYPAEWWKPVLYLYHTQLVCYNGAAACLGTGREEIYNLPKVKTPTPHQPRGTTNQWTNRVVVFSTYLSKGCGGGGLFALSILIGCGGEDL